jgi:hypothetical protein
VRQRLSAGQCPVPADFVRLTISSGETQKQRLGCETTLTQDSSEGQEQDMRNKIIYQLVSM